MLSYILLAVLIIVCFYLGAKLTFQAREKKKSRLKLDFDQAKDRETEGRS